MGPCSARVNPSRGTESDQRFARPGALLRPGGGVQDGRECGEEEAEQPDGQGTRELVPGRLAPWHVGGEVAEEAVVDLEHERGGAVDDARLDEAPARGPDLEAVIAR